MQTQIKHQILIYLGINAFASSAVSGHKLAMEAISNLCNFFLSNNLVISKELIKDSDTNQSVTVTLYTRTIV